VDGIAFARKVGPRCKVPDDDCVPRPTMGQSPDSPRRSRVENGSGRRRRTTHTALIVHAIVAPVHASAETTLRRGAGDVYVCAVSSRVAPCGLLPSSHRGRRARPSGDAWARALPPPRPSPSRRPAPMIGRLTFTAGLPPRGWTRRAKVAVTWAHFAKAPRRSRHRGVTTRVVVDSRWNESLLF
jgi:hypothetical protein